MGIQVTTATAPAQWACGFINGDWSGVDDSEEAAAEQWAESLLPWYVVGIDDSEDAPGGFMRWHDAAAFMPLAADCVAYILHKTDKESDQ